MAEPPGLALRGWLGLTWALQPLLPWHLKKRLKRGREDPDRWREKLGHTAAPRPEGRLVWLHAVGLGEVLALRGLIAKLATLAPDFHFLVTSGTRGAAQAFAANLPPRTIHQFAPLDAPGPARRFLAHWRPDLSIWAEQELWPGLVYRTDRAGIPLALVNARMNAAAFARRQKAGAVYRDILPRFALLSAQDEASAAHLEALGGEGVRHDGSLKALAPPLAHDEADLAKLETDIGPRPRWLAASTHPEDEALALVAHRLDLANRSDSLLIVVPRYPERGGELAATARAQGFTVAQRSAGEAITPQTEIHIADTLGELGLFYRLAPVAFVGGSMGPVEGHNPWEPARLGAAVLHGPRTANFAADYAALDTAEAALEVATAEALARSLDAPRTVAMPARAAALIEADMDRLDALCQKLVELI